MNTSDLIAIHLRLECKGIDARGDLVPIPCPNPDTMSRFYIAQHTDDGTYSRFVQHGIPEDVRTQLMALPPEEALHRHDRVEAILGPSDELHYGKCYVCPDRFTPADFPDVVLLTEDHGSLISDYDPEIEPSREAVFAVIVDGRIVSTCQSSREDERAAEAWVRTLPEYRGRGFARQATAAWAAHASARHKIPFYSHRMDNPASEGVARGLGLTPFIVDAAYS